MTKDLLVLVSLVGAAGSPLITIPGQLVYMCFILCQAHIIYSGMFFLSAILRDRQSFDSTFPGIGFGGSEGRMVGLLGVRLAPA